MSQRRFPLVDQDDLVGYVEKGPPRGFYLLCVALALVGVVGFVAGLLSDPARAWTALVWNWAFWSGLAIGGSIVVAAATASNGQWVRPVRRVAESFAAFLPVSFVLMIVLFFGLDHVYPWTREALPTKGAYLNEPFFIVREMVILLVLSGFALAQLYWSLRPDMGLLREKVGGWRRDLYTRLSGGWQGIDLEIERARVARSRLAPALVVLYALLWSVWAWDWLMSVEPEWVSTLFAAWIFMSHFLLALGATAIVTCRVRRYGSFEKAIDGTALHDMGKMVFAFTIFWTYLFFSQYLVIWYGRLPEETHFVKLRLWGAYEPIAIAVLLCVFLIPFLGLLGIKPKRNPTTLTLFAVVSGVGLWLFHFLLLAPGVFPDFIAFGWIEVAVAAGMFGLFSLCVLAFLSVFPPVAIAAGLPTDPEMAELVLTTGPQHD